MNLPGLVQVTRFKRMIDALGGPTDTVSHRKSLKVTADDIIASADKANHLLKTCSTEQGGTAATVRGLRGQGAAGGRASSAAHSFEPSRAAQARQRPAGRAIRLLPGPATLRQVGGGIRAQTRLRAG